MRPQQRFDYFLKRLTTLMGGERRKFSEDLMTYFRPKFLKIVLFG